MTTYAYNVLYSDIPHEEKRYMKKYNDKQELKKQKELENTKYSAYIHSLESNINKKVAPAPKVNYPNQKSFEYMNRNNNMVINPSVSTAARKHYSDTYATVGGDAKVNNHWQAWKHGSYEYNMNHPKTGHEVTDYSTYKNKPYRNNSTRIHYTNWKSVGTPVGDYGIDSTYSLSHQRSQQVASTTHLGIPRGVKYNRNVNTNHKVIRVGFPVNKHGVPMVNSVKGPLITVHYKDAVMVSGKPVNVTMYINRLVPYVGKTNVPTQLGQPAWYGTKSLKYPYSIFISHDMGRGIYLDGFISCHARYKFTDPKTGRPVPLKKRQMIGVNSLDGVDVHPKFNNKGQQHHFAGSQSSSIPFWDTINTVTHHIPNYNDVQEINRAYGKPMSTAGKWANFWIPNKNSSNKFNAQTNGRSTKYGLSSKLGNVWQFRQPSKDDDSRFNFYDKQANTTFLNQYTRGIVSKNNVSIYGHPITFDGGRTDNFYNAPVRKNVYTSGKHKHPSSFYENDIGDYKNPKAMFFSHSIFDNDFGSLPTLDVEYGTSEGVSNFSLFSLPGKDVEEPKFTCNNSRSRTSITEDVINKTTGASKKRTMLLSDYVGHNSRHFVSTTMFFNSTDTKPSRSDYYRWTEFRKNNRGNYIKVNGKRTRAFRNQTDATKWATTIKCIVPHHQHHHKITPPYVQLVHKSIAYNGKIHHAKIAGANGGILKHPDQSYDYLLKSHLPNVNDNAYWRDHAGNYHYYNSSADDYNLSDVVPNYVSISGTPRMHIGRHTIYPHVHNNYVEFHLTSAEMVAYAGRHYTVDIPVKANHLPTVTKNSWNAHRWFRYWNYAHQNVNIYYGYDSNRDDNKTKNTNHVPVEIKKIKDTIYHYDYNHNENLTNNSFPNGEQPFGLDNTCSTASTNPRSINYKNYRYNKYFKPGNKLAHGYASPSKDILHVSNKYGYVGSTFSAKSINQYKDGHKNWRYRFVYPSFNKRQARLNKLNNFKYFPRAERALRRNMKSTDVRSYGNRYVPIKLNPDGCTDNAYTRPNSNSKTGFSQSNYLPYIVPRINFIPNQTPTNHNRKPNNTPTHNPNGTPIPNNSSKRAINSENGQLIIDTDKQNHGLPFRFNMRAQNFLYGRHYYRDFKNDKVTMKIYSGNNQLYKGTRPLVGSHNNALSTIGRHHIKMDEWPRGNHDWEGYVEKNALNNAYKRYYDLNTSNIKNAKPGAMLPIHLVFKVSNPSNDRVDYQNVNSHAYLASQSPIKLTSFGRINKVANGKETNKTTNPNVAVKIRPERTINYLGSNNVRELDEALRVSLPQNAYAKTGYGLTGNDLAVDYMGHLEASQYAHKGTNMMMAFPRSFNRYDSHISYSKDNRSHYTKSYKKVNGKKKVIHHSMLGDVMMHIQPNEKPTDNVGKHHYSYGENNNLPSGLDTSNVVDGVSQDKDSNNEDTINNNKSNNTLANADEYYGDRFKQNLHAGDFVTTYGFYPRQATHNIRNLAPYRQNGYSPNSVYNNGGVVTIAKNKNEANGYQSHGGYNDPSIHRLHNGLLSRSNGYGMDKVFTKNNDNKFTHHTEDITDNGQNERMFTPLFMYNGKYNTYLERVYQTSRKHRLGGNFFDIDTKRPIHFYAHEYIAKDSQSKDQDELSLQPILTNPDGLYQVPKSSPAFPYYWLNDADNSSHKLNNKENRKIYRELASPSFRAGYLNHKGISLKDARAMFLNGTDINNSWKDASFESNFNHSQRI